jgi:flotillin
MQALLVFGGSAALVAVLVLVALIMLLRRVVPPNRADVVVRRSGTKVYSGDPSLGEQLPGEGVPFQYAGATYWYVPRFVPRWGMHVRMMPLTMMEIQVVDQVTFAKDNPQFVCDLSLYCRIVNVPIAAARWHMDQPGFKQTVNQLAINALRVATAKFAIEDTIARRKDLQDSIKEDLTDDFSKWGVRLEAVAIVDIKDAPNKTPVQDIAKKKEAEISAESRKMVAIKTKEAEFVEAENWQIAETRKVEAQEKVGIRTQEKDAEIAKKQQFAATEQMQVKQIQDVRTAEIDKLSRIQQAEGDRQATIVRAQGTKQQYILEGDGEGQRAKFIGEGEAAAISAKGLAEGKAKEAVAKGMNVLAKAGKDYRMIDYLQAVQGEFAKAMQQADIKYISTQPPGRFLELFTPQGGASLGGALSAFGGTGGTEELAKMLQNLRESAPGLYNAVRTAMEGSGNGGSEAEPEPAGNDTEEDAEWEETQGEE